MRKSDLRANWSTRDLLFAILCLFTVTFFVYRDFDIRMLYGYAVLALILGLHFLRRLRQNRAPALDLPGMALLFLAAVVLVNFLRPDSHHNADSISFIISMVICSGFVVLVQPSKHVSRISMGICFAGAVGIAVFVLFFDFNPNIFWNSFAPSLSDTAEEYLRYYVPKGYGFSLGGCTFSDYVLYMGLAVCCGCLVWNQKFDWKSILSIVFIGVFVYCILLVGRRGELLGAVVCLAILAFAQCSKKQRRFLVIGGIIAVAVAFAAVVALMPWLKQFPALYRYLWTIEWMLKGYDITSGRTELFALAWETFLAHPIFGLGWDNFYSVIPESIQEAHGQNIIEDAHNIYLQFLAETGIVSTPFLLAPMFYLYWLVCKQFTRLKGASGELRTARAFCTISFMIQSFLLVMGLIDPTFQKIVFWCFYGIALLFQRTALHLEGYTPTDPVSRLLNKLIHLCERPFVLVWNWAAGLLSKTRRIPS